MTDPTRLLLIVHPDDIETPPELLRIEAHAKLRGYLLDEVRASGRWPSRYCPRGHGYLEKPDPAVWGPVTEP